MYNKGNFIDIRTKEQISDLNTFMTKVYLWMFVGLFVTAFCSFLFLVFSTTSAYIQRSASPILYLITALELVLVMTLSTSIHKLKSSTAIILFLSYSALNGITLSYIAFIFSISSILLSFATAAVIFAIMALYGFFTKSDLTSFQNLFSIGIIGVIIVSLINMWLQNPSLDYYISIIGLAIFVGLVAIDNQKIKNIYYSSNSGDNAVLSSNLSIIAALTLYLDFINIFLYLLRIFNKRND
jgi:FtsH-binding integral membrane protein